MQLTRKYLAREKIPYKDAFFAVAPTDDISFQLYPFKDIVKVRSRFFFIDFFDSSSTRQNQKGIRLVKLDFEKTTLFFVEKIILRSFQQRKHTKKYHLVIL